LFTLPEHNPNASALSPPLNRTRHAFKLFRLLPYLKPKNQHDKHTLDPAKAIKEFAFAVLSLTFIDDKPLFPAIEANHFSDSLGFFDS
jgi:hypothetical protein